MKEVGADKVKVITMKIVDDNAMKVFFEKFPADLDELTAIKMICKVVQLSEEKCKDKDESYLDELAIAYDMIETFFGEKSINPASLL